MVHDQCTGFLLKHIPVLCAGLTNVAPSARFRIKIFNDDSISPGYVKPDPTSYENLRLRQALSLKSPW